MTLLEYRLLASSGTDMSFLMRDSSGVPRASFLGQGHAFFVLVTLPESRLVASSGVDKPFLFRDSSGVPPACFLGRGQAFSFA